MDWLPLFSTYETYLIANPLTVPLTSSFLARKLSRIRSAWWWTGALCAVDEGGTTRDDRTGGRMMDKRKRAKSWPWRLFIFQTAGGPPQRKAKIRTSLHVWSGQEKNVLKAIVSAERIERKNYITKRLRRMVLLKLNGWGWTLFTIFKLLYAICEAFTFFKAPPARVLSIPFIMRILKHKYWKIVGNVLTMYIFYLF